MRKPLDAAGKFFLQQRKLREQTPISRLDRRFCEPCCKGKVTGLQERCDCDCHDNT